VDSNCVNSTELKGLMKNLQDENKTLKLEKITIKKNQIHNDNEDDTTADETSTTTPTTTTNVEQNNNGENDKKNTSVCLRH